MEDDIVEYVNDDVVWKVGEDWDYAGDECDEDDGYVEEF